MGTKNSSTQVEQTTSNAGLPPLAPMGTVLEVRDIKQAIKFYETLGFQLDTALRFSIAVSWRTCICISLGSITISRSLWFSSTETEFVVKSTPTQSCGIARTVSSKAE